jgi:hypothetical protein
MRRPASLRVTRRVGRHLGVELRVCCLQVESRRNRERYLDFLFRHSRFLRDSYAKESSPRRFTYARPESCPPPWAGHCAMGAPKREEIGLAGGGRVTLDCPSMAKERFSCPHAVEGQSCVTNFPEKNPLMLVRNHCRPAWAWPCAVLRRRGALAGGGHWVWEKVPFDCRPVAKEQFVLPLRRREHPNVTSSQTSRHSSSVPCATKGRGFTSHLNTRTLEHSNTRTLEHSNTRTLEHSNT